MRKNGDTLEFVEMNRRKKECKNWYLLASRSRRLDCVEEETEKNKNNCTEPKTLLETEEELTHVLWLLSVLMD